MKREITHKEYQDILLKMLVFFDEFCQENDIRYSLAYGTMLGAVRHQGFIPWDDDIDIFMLREDYEKLDKYWRDDERYKLWRIMDKENFFMGYTVKIFDTHTTLLEKTPNHTINYGVFLDIFILDNIPEQPKKQIFHIKKYKVYKKLLTHVRNYAYKLGVFSKFLPSVYFFGKKIDNLNNKYINSKYVATCVFDEKDISRGIYRREIFENIIYLPFEEHYFPVVKEYHHCLEKYYGDYMIPPPLEMRTGHHVKAYFND